MSVYVCRGFSIPRTSGSGGSAGGDYPSTPSDGNTMLMEHDDEDDPSSSSTPPRRSLRLQKDFLQLLADLCRRAGDLSTCLPSERNPSGHTRVLCILRDRQTFDPRRGAEEEGDRLLAADDHSENLGETDLLDNTRETGRKDGLYPEHARRGDGEGEEVASGETVIDAARAIRSFLLCVTFFADYVIQQALKQVENEGIRNAESEGRRGAGGGRGGRGISGGGGPGKSKRKTQVSWEKSSLVEANRPEVRV